MTPELPQSNPTPTPPAQPEEPLPTPPSDPKRWLPWAIGAVILVIVSASAGAVGYRLSSQPLTTTAAPQPEIVGGSGPPAAQLEPAPTIVEAEIAEQTEKPTSPPTPVQATTTLGPTETFIKMSLEIQKIKTYGDYEAFVSKYMTKKGLAVFQTQSSALSEEEKVQEISKIKAYLQSSEKITNNIQEDISGSTATLTAPSRDGDDFSLITLELENNQWKVSPDDFRRLVEFTL